jgi:hypothetical protein
MQLLGNTAQRPTQSVGNERTRAYKRSRHVCRAENPKDSSIKVQGEEPEVGLGLRAVW